MKKVTKEQLISLRWALNHLPYCSHKENLLSLLELLKDDDTCNNCDKIVSLSKSWFDFISFYATSFTKRNINHHKKTLVGFAKNCSEFIQDYYETSNRSH